MRAPQARWSVQASRGLQAPGVHPGKMGSLDVCFLEIPEDMVIFKVTELSKEASQPWLQIEGLAVNRGTLSQRYQSMWLAQHSLWALCGLRLVEP